MLDLRLRPVKDRLVAPIATRLAGRIAPSVLTALGGAGSLAAAVAAWQEQPVVAVGCWLAGRVCDGLDGAVARVAGSANPAGGYADLVVDTVGYAAVPIGIAAAAGDAATWRIVALLLATFYVNAVAWLLLSALLERRRGPEGAAVRDETTSVTMPVGLVEGTETIVFFAVALAVPAIAPEVLAVMAVAVALSVVQRAVAVRRLLP